MPLQSSLQPCCPSLMKVDAVQSGNSAPRRNPTRSRGVTFRPRRSSIQGFTQKGNAMTDIAFDSNIREPRTGRLDIATLRELGARALFPWLTDAAMDWLVIAAAVAIIQLWPHVYTVLAGILIIGNRQHALAILGHDGTHYTISRNAALNDFLTDRK